jgi:hypothetical protein
MRVVSCASAILAAREITGCVLQGRGSNQLSLPGQWASRETASQSRPRAFKDRFLLIGTIDPDNLAPAERESCPLEWDFRELLHPVAGKRLNQFEANCFTSPVRADDNCDPLIEVEHIRCEYRPNSFSPRNSVRRATIPFPCSKTRITRSDNVANSPGRTIYV